MMPNVCVHYSKGLLAIMNMYYSYINYYSLLFMRSFSMIVWYTKNGRLLLMYYFFSVRALEDIKESIEELRYYRKKIFKPKS